MYIIFKFAIFTKFIYDANLKNHPDNQNINNNPESGVEIILSKLVMDNNIKYLSLDKNGINDINIFNLYKNNNNKELFDLTERLHSINDTTIKDRLFWTGSTMHKIFIDKNEKLINKLNQIRPTSNLERW